MTATAYAEAVKFNKGASRYIKSRREASRRAKQIREMNGPSSMEWVQSALFLYASKKYGLRDDLRKALWAYTSAMVVKLEEFVTNAEKIASRENIADSFHWTALQLRSAIRTHMKLLDMFKGEVVEIPEATSEGKSIHKIVHRPSDADSFESISNLLTDFSHNNPEASHLMPKPDEQLG